MKCLLVHAFLSILLMVTGAHRNNVCKTFADYYKFPDHNKNCSYNPDADLNITQIIRRHGYPVYTYHVTTADGYILSVFRIPHGKNSTDGPLGPPVFVQHGIQLNSVVFVDRGRKSLGFILADAGYDVWLGNFRGCLYSKKHKYLSTRTKKYWDFSYHENGVYDLPAQLDLVYNMTNEKITYIGYSMGTTAAYIYGVTYPDEAYNKLKIMISLAPIAFLRHLTSVAVKFLIPFVPIIEVILENAFHGEVLLRNRITTETLCLPYPFQMKFCETMIMLIFGFDYAQLDPETLPITLLQDIDSFSVKTISHYVQNIVSGKFQQYSYGTLGNIKKYGSVTPPQYNLTKMKVVNYLIRGSNDFLATEKNVEELNDALPERVKPYPVYVIPYTRFSHADFVEAKDVVALCYKHVVNFIDHLYKL